ncbi:MAG: hypothetical protein J6Q82_06990 [Clostridia bacterium]|nr:hypothetical protein [Clostridia bacterium]
MDENKEPEKAVEANAPDLSRAIEGILAHPELISTIAAALGKSAPSAQAPKEREAMTEVAPEPSVPLPKEIPPEALATIAPLLSGLSGVGGGMGKGAPPPRKDDPRACLLLALKPYLSTGRCQAIDDILRLTTLSEVLRGFGTFGKGGH